MPIDRSPLKPSKSADDLMRHKEDRANAEDEEMMTHIRALCRQRHHIQNKVFRIQETLNGQTGLPELEGLLCNLQSAYNEFASAHNQVVAIIPDDAMDEEEDVYVRFEALYNITFAEVKKRIMDYQTNPAPQVVIHQQPLKAPIPTFDGDYTNWPKFKSMFQDIISHSRDSDAVKLYHLEKALVGAAAGVLDAKTINDGNYAQAWRILTNRYENQRMIVETHIRGLLSLRKMTAKSSKELQQLVDNCTKHVESLEYQNQPLTGVSELVVVYLLTAALDDSTRLQWEQSLTSATGLPNYKDTVEFLKSQCKVLERWEAARSMTTTKTYTAPKQPTAKPKFVSQQVHAAAESTQDPKDKCDFCSGFHLNYQCNKLNALSANERMEKVRSAGICFNCLRKGHRSKNCPSTRSCRKCQRRHHTQLHDDNALATEIRATPSTAPQQVPKKTSDSSSATTSDRTNEQTVSTSCSCQPIQPTKTVLLLTAVILVSDKHEQHHQCRVLLDSGSQVNFISEKMANTLGIPRQPAGVPIAGINNIRTLARDKIAVSLQSRCSDFHTKLECLVVPKVTGTIPSKTIDVSSWDIPTGIKLADPSFFRAGSIDMLIGAELFFHLLKPGHLVIDEHLPELRESHLGWLIAGAVQVNVSCDATQYSQVASIDEVADSIHKFWEIEELPTASTMSTEEQQCEEHYIKTYSREPNGRFVVRLPIKSNADELDSCRSLALKRFYMLENRLQRNPDLRTQYVEFIHEYQHLGHCRKITETDADTIGKAYYLPHHAVLRPSSSTTKCRVVFDASAKSSENHLSLNDVLLVGPVVQSELYDILLRARMHRYVFSADISKMYRQINMHHDDTRFLRIFWRDQPTKPLQVLELTTVTYGTASAPFQATRCLKQLADDERKEFPLAAEIVAKDCYVDDILSGADTIEEAIESQRQLKAMLKKGGFPIHKWCSNSPEFLDRIPECEKEQTKRIEDNDINQVIKILGLLWDPSTDELLPAGIPTGVYDGNQPTTKRTIYSEVAKLFDPLGLFAPTIVLAKLLVQQLWRTQKGWDDPVDDNTNQQWLTLKQSLPTLTDFPIHRQVTINNAVMFELHGFADASNAAYGACIYIRSIQSDGRATSRLLTSKSKVAPLREVSIPRKELCAALLLARLVEKVVSIIGKKFHRTVLWSDSQIVLAWLNKHPGQLEVFVRNRVAEIQRLTEHYPWNYIRSSSNPADIVSRGQAPLDLVTNGIWWDGPPFLNESIYDIETPEEIADNELPELKRSVVAATASFHEQYPELTKYSSFRKLQRIIAWVLRFRNNASKKISRRILHRHLTVSELRQSLVVIIRVVQHAELSDEIHRIQSNTMCRRLRDLHPTYDDELLRVGGRLTHSRLPEEAKHQIILPNKNPVTQLLIRALHEEHLHVGPAGLLSVLRQRFWLLDARSTVRKVTRSCVRCFRTNPSDVFQLMGELPKQRVTPSSPFSVTGIDYAGPIQVKQGSYRSKVVKSYIAVFVCMSTKAVHLELVSDLTTNAFLAALQRFVSRRGIVSEMHSDNATTFHGAQHELHQLYELFRNENEVTRIIRYCQSKEMEWKFIPPDAPEFGGLWEAAVKSTKYHLKRVVGNVILTFEEMVTVLCEIEAILNSRPLFAVYNDPTDPDVITPAHFLIGRPMTAIPEPNYTDVSINRLTRWQHIQLMREHFWRAWSRDYLSSLQPRKKNRMKVENIRQGMVVLLHDKNRPPLQWKLGRVTAVYPGPDQLVRAVDVFSEGSTFRRAITKLSVLPIEDNQR